MKQQEITKWQTVVTWLEGYGRNLCEIAKENHITAEMQPVNGRWEVAVYCDSQALSRLNEAVCKSLLPTAANWQIDDAPNCGQSPFVDVYDPAADLDEGVPVARLFLT